MAEGEQVEEIVSGMDAMVVLDKTPFYACLLYTSRCV